MAVSATPTGSALYISVQVGTDSLGRPQLKKRIYSDLKASLTDDQVYNLGVVLAGLQSFPVVGNERVNQVDLVNA
ncbi:MAG TPA: DUF1659 domain-containing protein [Verrucomicrobiae bacterium]|nr:DUF1659 domain-containing protein [Verrucomicrobiae bacterium]